MMFFALAENAEEGEVEAFLFAEDRASDETFLLFGPIFLFRLTSVAPGTLEATLFTTQDFPSGAVTNVKGLGRVMRFG